jgi:serine/threonine protein kinase
MTLSKVFSDIESDDEKRFHSLFKDKYLMGEKIGEGAHGVVRHCIEKSTNLGFAVKTISLDREHILFLKENFTAIKALKHEHIIGYRALFFEMKSETCHLVMDYLPFPDLLHISPPN